MASVYREKGKATWTVAWTDSNRHRHIARGLLTKEIAEEIGRKREFQRQAAKHGIINKTDERHAREADREIEKHLAEFRTYMVTAKKDTEKYADETMDLIHRVFRHVGIERIDQIDRQKIEMGIPTLPPGKRVKDDRLSHRSCNKALSACRAFCYWMAQPGSSRIPLNPLSRVKGWDVEQDRRRIRNILTDRQVLDLIETTATQRTRGGMTGIDRMMRYALGVGTGFRQGTLFSLTPESFHLSAIPPFIRVEAKNIKSRKAVDHQISRELVDMLAPWLAAKPKGAPVFPKLPWADPMTAYRQDLKAAGIVYHEKDTDVYCDQHAQRGTFITSIIRTAGLKVAQDLAHHSTPVLTSRYGQMSVSDYAKALDGLPKMKRKAGKGRKIG